MQLAVAARSLEFLYDNLQRNTCSSASILAIARSATSALGFEIGASVRRYFGKHLPQHRCKSRELIRGPPCRCECGVHDTTRRVKQLLWLSPVAEMACDARRTHSATYFDVVSPKVSSTAWHLASSRQAARYFYDPDLIMALCYA